MGIDTNFSSNGGGVIEIRQLKQFKYGLRATWAKSEEKFARVEGGGIIKEPNIIGRKFNTMFQDAISKAK